MALAQVKPSTSRPLLVRSHRDLPPPVIVLGMHRSGTSILTQMLQVCGAFVGSRWDKHYESFYFRALNVELMSRAGATWYEPDAYLARRSDPAFHAESRRTMEARLERAFAGEFLGWKRRIPLGGGGPACWGWKDPRTCLTMDVWNEIFPEARLVHVTRHPLDVAISLQRREEQRQKKGKAPFPLVTGLEHNLRLWELHVADCLAQRRRQDRYYELRYEVLMASPRSELEKLARFCGLDASPHGLKAAAALADGSRTRRFDDERYLPWRSRVAELPSARELGYE